VQAVGELDDEHPDVLRHRDDHLADGLGLRRVAVLDLVELRDAVDEHRDLVAEVGAHLVERVRGVLDRVVQQGRRRRLRADAEVGEDLRDRDRVRDVRLAALALLPLVGALRRRCRRAR
jgi:hypothetical protein